MESALRKIQDKLQANLSSLSALKKIGGGARFFGNTKRGESAELASDLNSQDKDKQKNAVKRIIANMTLGRDVSQLFADVVKLGQTTNLELKKLVYLYVLNTAKLQPDKALMAVNTFLQDIQHASPIVRALALRTMLCVRVECVTEYTLEPLRRALSDTDPYVRKTAAVGLGKLFHQNPRLFEEQGFIDNLLEQLSDLPIVAANAAIVLSEISQFATTPISIAAPKVNGNRMLNALAECTEWGQVYILELMSAYHPASWDEASTIVERVAPRLSSSNPAVVLGAVKVMTVLFTKFSDVDREPYLPRINAAVLSLAKADHESQYFALRNIFVLLELFPTLLQEQTESFFIRFTDPTYLKLEKLRLIMRLLNRTSATRVMSELTEYANEVDVTFVRDVVSAVGTACIKCDNIAPQCVALLLSIARKRPEVFSAVIIATKNVVRKYPDMVVDLLVPLITDFGVESVEDEEAKASFVWMLGEFCDVIENGDQLVRNYIESFAEQEVSVQLSLLTAVVKIFIRNPSGMEATLNHVLEVATTVCVDPDLRDRAWMYWRLLSKGIGVERMKRIIHGRKPPAELERRLGDGMTVGELAMCINTAAAAFGRPQRSFLPSYGLAGEFSDDLDEESEGDAPEGEGQKETTAQPPRPPVPQPNYGPGTQAARPSPTVAQPVHIDPFEAAPPSRSSLPPRPAVVDPFDFRPAPSPLTAPASQPKPTGNVSFDEMFGPSSSAPSTPAAPTLPQVVDPSQGSGLGIYCGLDVAEEPYWCRLTLANRSAAPISDFAMQFNKNIFGFVPAASIGESFPQNRLEPGESATFSVPIRARESHFDESRIAVQIGVKSSVGLSAFFVNVPPTNFLLVAPPLSPQEFASQWRALDPAYEIKQQLSVNVVRKANSDAKAFAAALGRHRIHVVVYRDLEATHAYYGCVKTHTGVTCQFEMLIAKDGVSVSTVSVKHQRASELRGLIQNALESAALSA